MAEGFEVLLELAKQDDGYAQYRLGVMYEHGDDVPQSYINTVNKV